MLASCWRCGDLLVEICLLLVGDLVIYWWIYVSFLVEMW